MTHPITINCESAGQNPRPARPTDGDIRATIYGIEGIFTNVEAIDDCTDEARVSLIAAGLQLCRRTSERF
ncbi:MAG: hypothetical protein U1E60_19035 [Reyranellaceae bacterium]